MSDYLKEVEEAIRANCRCNFKRVGRTHVCENAESERAWVGDVEAYELIGHPAAKKVYAWGHNHGPGGTWEITTVLEIPPVDSPETAVRVAIAAYIRNKHLPRSPNREERAT